MRRRIGGGIVNQTWIQEAFATANVTKWYLSIFLCQLSHSRMHSHQIIVTISRNLNEELTVSAGIQELNLVGDVISKIQFAGM